MSDSSNSGTPATDVHPSLSEERFHDYEGYVVPWYVRLMWLGFWILAVWYVVSFLLPILPIEISNPP